MANPHVGSSFPEFLQAEGLREEVDALTEAKMSEAPARYLVTLKDGTDKASVILRLEREYGLTHIRGAEWRFEVFSADVRDPDALASDPNVQSIRLESTKEVL